MGDNIGRRDFMSDVGKTALGFSLFGRSPDGGLGKNALGPASEAGTTNAGYAAFCRALEQLSPVIYEPRTLSYNRDRFILLPLEKDEDELAVPISEVVNLPDGNPLKTYYIEREDGSESVACGQFDLTDTERAEFWDAPDTFVADNNAVGSYDIDRRYVDGQVHVILSDIAQPPALDTTDTMGVDHYYGESFDAWAEDETGYIQFHSAYTEPEHILPVTLYQEISRGEAVIEDLDRDQRTLYGLLQQT